MHRGRRIALVAHCLLNVNARVGGLAGYAGVHPVIGMLAERGYGVVQLPCPEMLTGGGQRLPAPVEVYDTAEFNRLCADLADGVADVVRRHLDAGDAVELLVGVEGSPSCGVGLTNTAAGAEWVPGGPTTRVAGAGVYVRALRERLSPLGVTFAAVDGRDEDLGVGRVIATIDR